MFKKEKKEVLSVTTQIEKNAIIDFLETAEGNNAELLEKASEIEVQYSRDECNAFIGNIIEIRNAMKEYCNNRSNCNNCPLEYCFCELFFDDGLAKILEDISDE